MTSIEEIIAAMRRSPQGIRFRDLCQVCEAFFGKARQGGSSHRLYKTPWQGDPRVNIQNDKGMAKSYFRAASAQGHRPFGGRTWHSKMIATRTA